ncbi:unnamed protein product [Callosobruchus maculatus]|uniref:Uncharacterized protein n=2 Tax=Callosobruchus maculatus TaxID=64391 RepID=A0A653BEC1_CALMS|nr:unnamed protein product [Callosobruchus maculatus]
MMNHEVHADVHRYQSANKRMIIHRDPLQLNLSLAVPGILAVSTRTTGNTTLLYWILPANPPHPTLLVFPLRCR